MHNYDRGLVMETQRPERNACFNASHRAHSNMLSLAPQMMCEPSSEFAKGCMPTRNEQSGGCTPGRACIPLQLVVCRYECF
ncbi:hypothetical protein WJX74_009249 [Apatococcus lobatus]|uniref:Uncharacterized protein n=2 Tax=Apatococcus TaxID=904362 RepID=A0AAW1SS86_9CHLO